MPTNNLDKQEIKKFDQLADQWWDPYGPMKPLHQLNPLRLKFVTTHSKPNQSILDVGCGAGLLCESLAQAGQQLTGIDMSPQVIAVAKQHAKQSNLSIEYQQIEVEQLHQQSSQRFDVVTCMELLEHVPDPSQLIQACQRMLKPGGLIFFSTIHRNFKAYLHTIIAAEYLLQMLPKGTHHYANFIRPAELNHWAMQANLTLVDLQGMSYRPWSQSFYLSTDVSVNYLACFRDKS